MCFVANTTTRVVPAQADTGPFLDSQVTEPAKPTFVNTDSAACHRSSRHPVRRDPEPCVVRFPCTDTGCLWRRLLSTLLCMAASHCTRAVGEFGLRLALATRATHLALRHQNSRHRRPFEDFSSHSLHESKTPTRRPSCRRLTRRLSSVRVVEVIFIVQFGSNKNGLTPAHRPFLGTTCIHGASPLSVK